MLFKDMDIEQLLSHVNYKLGLGESLTKIASELGVNESSIRKKLNKAGYKRSGNEFIVVGQSGGQVVPTVIKSKVEKERQVDVIQQGGNVLQEKDKENFIELMNNFNIIMEMVQQYKKDSVIPAGGIVVQLPKEENGEYKTSIRVNKVVMDMFRNFCGKHKEFTQKDLLSMALLEYINRYS